LSTAADIASATGATFLCETFPARLERGAGRPGVDRLAYLAEFAAMQLEGIRHLVLVDAASPVSFFAYPGKPSDLVPAGCAVHRVAGPADDVPAAVAELASLLGVAAGSGPRMEATRPGMPEGPLTSQAVCQALGALLPEEAIVSDEGNTSGLFAPGATVGSPPHDWLCLTGGAIGQGLPVATGAAVAAPDRPVLALEADGSALYTIQALWTQAREQLDVTTVLINNAAYAILRMELARTAAGEAGERASRMLDLSDPTPGFTEISTGMGVPATRVSTAQDLDQALRRAYAEPGPHLIEAIVSSPRAAGRM
jgi:acetolactate synthase-1/2/3 large subunit